MAELTVFSAPKGFEDPFIARLQRNAIRSWTRLGPEVEVLLVGDEPGLVEAASSLKVRLLPDVERNTQGTPLVRSIFDRARAASSTGLLAYVNADVVLFPDLPAAARAVADRQERFLLVSRRWDLAIQEDLDFGEDWEARLREDLQRRGRLHAPAGSDLFVFPRTCFESMPPLTIGRAGWDNWMIYQARRLRWPVVDASAAVTLIHQDHDYRHLPGGQPHYRLPESDENVRLAGGRRTVFTLMDADWRMGPNGLRRSPWTWAHTMREVETFPLRILGSPMIAAIAFALFHPVKAAGEWRGRIGYGLRRLTGKTRSPGAAGGRG